MSRRRPPLSALVLLLAVAALLGCAKKEDVIVQTGAGRSLTAPAIDADPIALLPSNAIGVLTLDARQLLASRFGARLLAITQANSPLPEAAKFDPARDLDRVYLGFYSMQGADIAGVAVGRFSPESIEKAAQATPRTANGQEVTRSEYAGRVLYTANAIGFSVLTERTVLLGNETGIRRALDRIQEGRARRKLPKWMLDLLASPKAPLVGGADLTSNPLPAAARDQLPFLDGMETLSVVGNFQEPGLNLAGTLTYAEAEAASRGADSLKRLHGRLSTMGPLMAIVGIPQPVRSLDARAAGDKVQFVLGVDGDAIAVLLEKAQAYLRAFAPANRASLPPSAAP